MNFLGFLVSLFFLRSVCANSSEKACSVCACYKQDGTVILDCYGMELEELPTDIPRDVEKIDLVGNLLEDFGYTNFFEKELPYLKDLYMNNNPITRISPGAFAFAPSLSTLLLHHIELTHLQNGTFDNLKKLKKLEMQNANIETLDSRVFHDLPNVHEIYIHENNIVDLHELQFLNLTHLDTLYMELNDFPAPTCCELCGLTDNMRIRMQRMNYNKSTIECGCGGAVQCGDITCFADSCEVFEFYSAAYTVSYSAALVLLVSLIWAAFYII